MLGTRCAIAWILAALALLGCATNENFDNIADQSRLGRIESLKDDGRTWEAFTEAAPILLKNNDKDIPRTIRLLRSFPNLLEEIETSIEINISIASDDPQPSFVLDEFHKALRHIDAYSALPAAGEQRVEQLREYALTSLEKATAEPFPLREISLEKLDYYGGDQYFPQKIAEELKSRKLAALTRTLSIDQPLSDEQLHNYIDVAEQRGPDSRLAQKLRTSLPGLTVNPETLRALDKLFPLYVKKAKEKSKQTIPLVSADGDSGLLAFDLRKTLNSDSSGLVEFVEAKQQDGSHIEVKVLQWSVGKLPEQRQTMRYARHQVNFGAAVMLMPNNSTYVYELSQGGSKFDYAVRVIVRNEGIVVRTQMVRDALKEEWRKCSNARVVNVFGGAEPADFVANNHMRERCSGSTTRISGAELEKRAIKNVADAIDDLEVVQKRKRNIMLPEV